MFLFAISSRLLATGRIFFLFLYLRELILLTQFFLGSHSPEVCLLSYLFHLEANSWNVDVNTHNRCKRNLTLWDCPWCTQKICGKRGRWALVISPHLNVLFLLFSSPCQGGLWTHLLQVIRKCLQCLISNKCPSTYHEEQHGRAMYNVNRFREHGHVS